MAEDTVVDELKGEFMTTYEEALKLLANVQILEANNAETSFQAASASSSNELDKLDASLTGLLGTYLASIRRRRNALNLLERLSNEILETIFYFAVHSEPPTPSLVPVPNPYSPQIRPNFESNRQTLEKKHRHTRFYLSHVCSRWRQLILADARLWSNIEYDATSRRLAELSFKRAGQAPLDVRFAPAYHSPSAVNSLPKLLEQLSSRNSQLRSLEVLLPHMSMAGEYPSLVPLLSGPMPLIQSLTVRSCQPTSTADPWSMEGNDLQSATLTTLCDGHAPALTRLNLQSFVLPWSLSAFTSLTSLVLAYCSFQNPSPNEDFISILHKLPSLRQLSLVNCKFLCAHNATSEPANMPGLQMMRLQDLSPEDTSRILSSIHTPSSLRLSVKVIFDDAEGVSAFTRMNFQLSEVLDTVRDLQVTITDHGSGIQFMQFVGSRVKSGLKKNTYFELSCSGTFNFDSAAAILHPLYVPQCERLSVSWSDHMTWGGPRVGGPVAHTSSDLVFILRRCPKVERLMLIYPKNASTLDALNMRQSDHDTTLVCPNMDALEIECSIGMNFDEQLRQIVAKRPGSLKQLLLKGTQNLKPGTVDYLRECVDEVYCIGEENDIAAFDGAQGVSHVVWNANGWGDPMDGRVDGW